MKHLIFFIFVMALLMFWPDNNYKDNIVSYMDKTASQLPFSVPDAPNPGGVDIIAYREGLASYNNIRLMPGVVFIGNSDYFGYKKANRLDKRVNRRLPRNKESV